MVELARALSAIKDERYRRCFLARVEYRRLSDNSAVAFYSERVKKSARLDKLRVVGYDAAQAAVLELMASIMFGTGSTGQSNQPDWSQVTAWHSFAAAEVGEFSRLSGDMNEIHLSDRPVVQGMLLLRQVLSDFGDRSLTMRFYAPVLAGEQVFLQRGTASLWGCTREQGIVFSIEG